MNGHFVGIVPRMNVGSKWALTSLKCLKKGKKIGRGVFWILILWHLWRFWDLGVIIATVQLSSKPFINHKLIFKLINSPLLLPPPLWPDSASETIHCGELFLSGSCQLDLEVTVLWNRVHAAPSPLTRQSCLPSSRHTSDKPPCGTCRTACPAGACLELSCS